MSNDVPLMEDLSNQLGALFDDPEISRLPETLKELWSRMRALKMTLSALNDDRSARIDAQLDELCGLTSPSQSNSEPPSPPGNLGEESLSNPRSTNPGSIVNQDSITSDTSSNEHHIPPWFASESENPFDWSRMGDNTPKISHGLWSRPRHVTFSLPDLGNEFSESESTTPDASHSARVASNSNPDFSANNLPRRREGTTININSSASPIFGSDEVIGSPPAGPSSSRSAPANDQSSERLLPAWQTNAIRPRPNVEKPTGPASHRSFFPNSRSSTNASAPTSTPTSSSTQFPHASIDSRPPFPVPRPPEPEVVAMDADGGDENTRERNQRTIFVVGQSPSPSSTDLFSKIGEFL